ncbi:MAG: YceI family protein [Bacteroidetes bacterium]|nr:MAG: YceI family protein [Bacteroidota bacterium]
MRKFAKLGFAMLVLSIAFAATTKDKLYRLESGRIHFFSKAPLENIEAESKVFAAVLNPKNRNFVFSVAINTFKFDKPLMQEHFNENYMESDKYPKGKFIGKINETVDLLKDSTYKVTVTGKLDLHGVEKDRTMDATVTVKNGKMDLSSKFTVKLEDHNIEIPSMVIQNIAEVIDVDIEATLKYDE